MPVLRVDDEVWNWLKAHATPFEDTPNSVLRRLAGLDPTARPRAISGSSKKTREERSVGPRGRVADYTVTKRPDRHSHWWYQIYQRKLLTKSRAGEFYVVVICDRDSPNEIRFRLPYTFLRDEVLNNAKLEADKRYMFEVKKDSYEFVFHPGIRFDGRRFIADKTND